MVEKFYIKISQTIYMYTNTVFRIQCIYISRPVGSDEGLATRIHAHGTLSQMATSLLRVDTVCR